MSVTADDLDAALSTVAAVLTPATGLDWSVRAGEVEWDCWHTAEHLGDGLISYAGQLVIQPDGRYGRFLAKAENGASAAEVLEFAVAGGRILAAVVRATAPGTRAYHPSGRADAAGFAAMGCVEILVHGEDMARGLGVALDPPGEVCGRILARLYPDVAAEVAGLDPWPALLWATGRTELSGLPRRTQWRWHGAPLGG